MAPRPMKKFLVTYHMNGTAKRKAAKMQKTMTPADREAAMQAWGAWAAKLGDALLEMGAPLGEGLTLDGSKDIKAARGSLSGYSIVQAKSLAGAKNLLKKHPHLSWVDAGCTVEVREMMPM